MIPAFSSTLLDAAPANSGFTPSILAVTALLDFAGLAAAIWTVWSSIWFLPGGNVLRAFRFISLGSLAFALSHVVDTILQLLDVDAATLIHQGFVLTSVLLFLPGLADLADALPAFNAAPGEQLPSIKFWPLVIILTISSSTLSFILYGAGSLAETATFIILDGSLLVLSGTCMALVVRARLGGPIGRSLWLALLGLVLFSLAHPVQAWFYAQTNYPPDLLGIVHRLIVIPAFFLFAISISNVARSFNQAAAA